MFVLGIDPGLSRCGYGLVAHGGAGLSAGAAGVLTTPVDVELPARLAMLAADLMALLDDLSPDAVVVERVFFQTNVRTAMSVGQASGLALAAAASAGIEVAQYTANEAKLAVAGDGAASKGQVAKMVAAILGLPEAPKPPDAADALALAICHLNSTVIARRAAGQVPRSSCTEAMRTASVRKGSDPPTRTRTRAGAGGAPALVPAAGAAR